MSRHGPGFPMEVCVSTHFLGRDLEWSERCRDNNLMSRHGLASPGGRDLETMSRPGLGLDKEGRSRHEPTA